MLTQMRNYQRFESKDLRVIGKQTQEGIESQLLAMQTPFGYRRVAELFQPEGEGPYAAILYVHWYEPESGDSNRSQFEEEAKEMTRSGAVDSGAKVFISGSKKRSARSASRQSPIEIASPCKSLNPDAISTP